MRGAPLLALNYVLDGPAAPTCTNTMNANPHQAASRSPIPQTQACQRLMTVVQPLRVMTITRLVDSVISASPNVLTAANEDLSTKPQRLRWKSRYVNDFASYLAVSGI
jgi:hypothetical protein